MGGVPEEAEGRLTAPSESLQDLFPVPQLRPARADEGEQKQFAQGRSVPFAVHTNIVAQPGQTVLVEEN